MTQQSKTFLSSGGGKDSTFAFFNAIESGELKVDTMLTTITEPYQRVSMHGIRKSLIARQAKSLGIRLKSVDIPAPCDDNTYEAKMKQTISELTDDGYTKAIFGDIYLDDIREYREKNFKGTAIEPVFPLWKIDTKILSRDFIDLGFKAVIVCVDTEKLSGEFSGRLYNDNFLNNLPEGIDPCGENGEFHTFCYAGPCFKDEITFQRGDVVLRDDRFMYCDLLDPYEE